MFFVSSMGACHVAIVRLVPKNMPHAAQVMVHQREGNRELRGHDQHRRGRLEGVHRGHQVALQRHCARAPCACTTAWSADFRGVAHRPIIMSLALPASLQPPLEVLTWPPERCQVKENTPSYSYLTGKLGSSVRSRRETEARRTQRAPRVSTVPVTRFIMDVTALMGIL